ncbi:RIP metalloprotease RseP [Desulfuromonas sp. AOP6]|uniref:RIP metalloprotease RseP n=1 Tax=Desulfuromonas sp. AOP6 TaxID=1566351 RepID=UPI001281D959|nr:RIP metalloprotease RseP [Desulfuromonas sp. AOP6]BCA80630.1 zinc metalloprotease [Desulfuromonas sp. AOP6]
MMTAFWGIMTLGILIFVHELGHFLVAKWSGVKVLRFSLGFGPRLLGWKKGETEYLVCLLPFGGYVQMHGERKNGPEEEPVCSDDDRAFTNKGVLTRMAIVAAGPLTNLLLPFLILPVAYIVGVQTPAYQIETPHIGYIATESQADDGGFLPGDLLESIDGRSVATWEDANSVFAMAAKEEVNITIRRQGQRQDLRLAKVAGESYDLRSVGIFPEQVALLGEVFEGDPAGEVGLRVGDRIVAIDGTPINSWYDVGTVINASGGDEIDVEVQRENGLLHFTMLPEQNAQGRFLIGISPLQETYLKHFPPLEAIKAGAQKTVELMRLTGDFLRQLVAGNISTDNIGGPVMIVQTAGAAAETGIAATLLFLAFLSIQLGFLNLLPVPVLDGGHLVFFLIELIFRRPLPQAAQETALKFGLLLLLLLMGLALFNDFSRFFS